MEDLNKISTTKVGDSIHFYVNNKDSKGTVVKMDHSYITVLKDDGNFQHIHINDTFFVKDILINKTWNDMDATEQYDMLVNIHAPTPRFLGKKWEVLPKELKEALVKSTPEGGKVSGVNTGVKIPKGGGEDVGDAEEDYEGIHIEEDKEQFKHDEVKPTTKNNAMEASHKDDEVKEEWDGKFTSKEKEGNVFSHTLIKPNKNDALELGGAVTSGTAGVSNAVYGGEDKERENQNSVIGKPKIKKSWENWLEKEGGMGDGGSPATTQGRDSGYETFNPVYGKKQRHGGQSKDKEEDEMQEK